MFEVTELAASVPGALMLRAGNRYRQDQRVEGVPVQDHIDAADEWFVGEDRDLRFTFVAGVVAGIETWDLELAFYPRKASVLTVPLLTVAAVGTAQVDADLEADPPVVFAAAYAVAPVTAAESALLGAGLFQFVLRRTDAGSAAVLSYGGAELRAAVNP